MSGHINDKIPFGHLYVAVSLARLFYEFTRHALKRDINPFVVDLLIKMCSTSATVEYLVGYCS
jgi:hypothetical protein